MVKAKELFDQGMKRLENFRVEGLMPALKYCNEGAIEDVLNTNGSAYYQFSTCLVDVLKPKQIVELGGAMGVWDLCVLHALPQESKLHSITLPEHGLEFSFVKEKYSNFYPIVGDAKDLKNWQGIDLMKTDLWFIDLGIAELHDANLLKEILTIYKPYFKNGAIILFDDIHKSKEMTEVWDSIDWDKKDCSDPLHYSGFGITVYDKV